MATFAAKDDVTPVESTSSAVSWAAVFGGAVTAAAVTLILLLVGSGLGLTMVSPWKAESASAETISTTGAIWLVVVQWLSAALGGYLAGRLRTKWVGVHTDEIYFRDTAHGLLAWAVATLLVAALVSSAATSVARGVTGAAGAVAGAAGATAVATGENTNNITQYFSDALLRPANPANPPQGQVPSGALGEVARILSNAAVAGALPADDRSYLERLIAARTGSSEAEAKARIDAVLKQAEDAKAKAQKVADDARKTAATVALLGALSLMVGAFIAAVSGALGGRQRDDDPDVMKKY
ncbi:hypothetical protein J2Y48_002307 [Mycoplana sp. BE70]|uniref:hypothetical protein n=1 Tax=Mycoplana sp. BE70 TaxID=2817775 RepID=UPI002857F6DE|nr:hypothetical protein [Mycoplana sp. BE70]MDR6757011.1 hypothetical protein [Mycoplana sp. BE70]